MVPKTSVTRTWATLLKLLGVIFCRQRHLVSQFRLADKIWSYDDQHNDGKAQQISAFSRDVFGGEPYVYVFDNKC